LGKIFRKLFNLYPGEEKKAFLLATLGFLWALSVTCALKFADALFLLHIGAESLPTAYALAALGNIVIASFLFYGFHSVSPSRLFLIIIGVGITFYAFILFCLYQHIGHDSQYLWFALKIFGFIFFTVVITCFWTFVDQYYHHQDAKRLYSLFSSSVFIGLGSTGFIMRMGVLSVEHLIGVVLLLLGVTFYWIQLITRRLTVVPDESETENVGADSNQTWGAIIKSILTSRFTILLMIGNLLIQVLSVITEYNYLSDFDKYFDAQHSLSSTGEEMPP